MDPSIYLEIERLRKTGIQTVQARYAEVFGRGTRSTHRGHLIRRIAWKLQALEHGDVTGAMIERALEMAADREFEGHGGASGKRRRADPRLPAPGVELTREYRRRLVAVKVLASGFEYEGQRYASLSAIARVVTGTPWNGLVFFGLAKRGDKRQRRGRRRAGSRSLKQEVGHAA
jgi:hypothetical protein